MCFCRNRKAFFYLPTVFTLSIGTNRADLNQLQSATSDWIDTVCKLSSKFFGTSTSSKTDLFKFLEKHGKEYGKEIIFRVSMVIETQRLCQIKEKHLVQ